MSEVKLDAQKATHIASASGDWGYPLKPGRRKIIATSQQPWREIWTDDETRSLQGRFVAGITNTPIGDVVVMAVCIPWLMAHVTGGQRDKSNWEEHLDCINRLKPHVERAITTGLPVIIGGDFNQRLPRTRAPIRAYDALSELLSEFEIISAGIDTPGHKPGLLNHIAVKGLSSLRETVWPGVIDGTRLTDHAGICATLKSLS